MAQLLRRFVVWERDVCGRRRTWLQDDIVNARLYTWKCCISLRAFPIFLPAIDPRCLAFFKISVVDARRFQVLNAPPLCEFPRTEIIQGSVASSEAIYFLERNAERALLSHRTTAHRHFRHLLALLHLGFLLKLRTLQQVAAAERRHPERAYEFCCCHILLVVITCKVELLRGRSNRAWLVGPVEV